MLLLFFWGTITLWFDIRYNCRTKPPVSADRTVSSHSVCKPNCPTVRNGLYQLALTFTSHISTDRPGAALHSANFTNSSSHSFHQTLKVKMEKYNTNVYNINNSPSQQTQIERTGWAQAEWVGNIRMLLPKTNYRSYSKGTLTCYDGYFKYE